MPLLKNGDHWLIKYKLHHILFWGFYHYIWGVIAVGNPLKAASSLLMLPIAIKFAFYVIFQAIAVYLNLYYLIPRFLEKSRFIAYISYLLITILGTSSLIVSGYYLGAIVAEENFEAIYGPGTYCLYYFYSAALPSTLASMTLAMSIKLAMSWIRTKRRQQLLEKEKLETELNFLKNQFNPHFLFNTINSIFFLIHKNPEKASVSLAKFSELLRYQLYECNDRQIPLKREIMYLENSIELERLRLNNKVEVNFQVNAAHAAYLSIAPFILMTFIENAFKHVSKNAGQPNWITIKIDVQKKLFDFYVANSIPGDIYTHKESYNGIGLKNVKRRLDLIYTGKYELDIQHRPCTYEVRLRLHLAELAVPQPTGKQFLSANIYK